MWSRARQGVVDRVMTVDTAGGAEDPQQEPTQVGVEDLLSALSVCSQLSPESHGRLQERMLVALSRRY